MNLSTLLGNQEPKTLTYGDEKSPLLLQVHTQSSKVAKQAYREMQLSIFEYMKNEDNIGEIDGKRNLKPELLNDLALNYLCSLVVGWDGLKDGNKKVSFDKELLKQAIENNQDLAEAISIFSQDELGNFQGK